MPSAVEYRPRRYVIPRGRLAQAAAAATTRTRTRESAATASISHRAAQPPLVVPAPAPQYSAAASVANSSLSPPPPSPQHQNNRSVRLRSEVFTCWRTALPNGRVQFNCKATQVRVFAPITAAAAALSCDPVSKQLLPSPAMVHTTRHHDYDHDGPEPSSPELSPPASPKAVTPRSRKAAPLPRAPPQPNNALLSGTPKMLQFPVLLVASWLLSAGLYSAIIPFTAGDLATVSRNPGGWNEIALLVGFNALELAAGWFGAYDGYDLAALTLLTHFPYLFLLTGFYSIKPSTVVVSLVVDVLSVLVPTHLLRPLSAAHDPAAPARLIANRSIVSDLPVQVYTSSLGAAIYALTLALALQAGLPSFLLSHFDSVQSVELAYSVYLLPILVLSFVPLGVAAKIFVFTPATTAKRDSKDVSLERFDPQTATLADTVLYNVWGFRRRTRVAIVRTATLAAMTAANTTLQVAAHVAGTDVVGAAAWAATWTAAAATTGYVFWWIANVSEVKQE